MWCCRGPRWPCRGGKIDPNRAAPQRARAAANDVSRGASRRRNDYLNQQYAVYSANSDQAAVLPKKALNFKGRLVSYADSRSRSRMVADSGLTTGCPRRASRSRLSRRNRRPRTRSRRRPVWFSVSRAVAAMAFRPSARRSHAQVHSNEQGPERPDAECGCHWGPRSFDESPCPAPEKGKCSGPRQLLRPRAQQREPARAPVARASPSSAATTYQKSTSAPTASSGARRPWRRLPPRRTPRGEVAGPKERERPTVGLLRRRRGRGLQAGPARLWHRRGKR